MKAKGLGRIELLAWVNSISMSEYQTINQLSDGVGFCHVVDAFYSNSVDINRLKFNSQSLEDWERNFLVLKDAFNKINCPKNVDYQNLVKSKFNINFEFLQYLYDYILKLFPSEIGNVKYNAYNKRLDALKSQYGKIPLDNIKKYLPNYLIPSENVIKYEKMKTYTEEDTEKERVNMLLDKYKDFLTLLKEDLKKSIENNLILSADILEIEEEKNYYLEKLKTIHNFTKTKSEKIVIEENKSHADEVFKILSHVPEDFK